MATDQHFAEYVRDQMSAAGSVTSRKMFGEYAVYLDGKIVALLCDNQCYVKPTNAGRAFLGTVTEMPPFPGANPYFLIADELDDRQRLVELIRITVRELPAPKPKKAKAAGTSAKKGAKPALTTPSRPAATKAAKAGAKAGAKKSVPAKKRPT